MSRRTNKGPMYGQVVVGPPGSGKTTFCNGMQQYLNLLGRNALVLNFDPANEAHAPVAAAADDDDDDDADNTKEEEEDNHLPYTTLMDVCEDVVNLSSVMEQLGLGPNGGLVYCIEYMETHMEDILQMISTRIDEWMISSSMEKEENHGGSQPAQERPPYLLIDLPGQIELYTHGTCIQRILQALVKKLDLRLVAVQLVDAHYCLDATKFISAALLGTTTMLRLELPTVNVLSKVDLLMASTGGGSSPAVAKGNSQEDSDKDDHDEEEEDYDVPMVGNDLPFSLDYFTECQDLQRLIPYLNSATDPHDGAGAADNHYDPMYDYTEDPDYQKARRKTRHSAFFRKHEKLHERLAEVVEDFSLLSFMPLDISNAESVGRVLAKIDKCNGYVFLSSTTATAAGAAGQSEMEDMFSCAIQNETSTSSYEAISQIQERLSYQDSISELQQQQQ